MTVSQQDHALRGASGRARPRSSRHPTKSSCATASESAEKQCFSRVVRAAALLLRGLRSSGTSLDIPTVEQGHLLDSACESRVAWARRLDHGAGVLRLDGAFHARTFEPRSRTTPHNRSATLSSPDSRSREAFWFLNGGRCWGKLAGVIAKVRFPRWRVGSRLIPGTLATAIAAMQRRETRPMPQTFRALLRGDQLEWTSRRPTVIPADQPVLVEVTISEEPFEAKTESGRSMAEILEQLARTGSFAEISDPVEWQRDLRAGCHWRQL